METHRLTPPISDKDVLKIRSGDRVLITGTIYSARDQAHKRLFELLIKGEALPIPIKGSIIYYMGPTPAPPGRPIGAAGPTTSYRMDPYTPKLLEAGLKITIGKGKRSQEVREALKTFKGLYLAATGGAGALISKCIKEARVVAYEDLGPEAIRELYVEEFPAIVIYDAYGNDLYQEGVKCYAR
ncbi:MAG: Fe-S-containing hydro-lyase [Desulfatiglandales bacterium]